jgi:hypothetical protein
MVNITEKIKELVYRKTKMTYLLKLITGLRRR